MDLLEPSIGQLETWMLGRRGTPAEPWKEVLKRDPCAFCNTTEESFRTDSEIERGIVYPDTITIDHIFPRQLDLHRGWLNQTASCWTCNQAKKNMPLLDFLLKRKRKNVSSRSGL